MVHNLLTSKSLYVSKILQKIGQCPSHNRLCLANLNTKCGPWRVLFFGTDAFALENLQKLELEYRSQRLVKRLEIVTSYKGTDNAMINFAKEHNIKIHSWPLSIPISDFDVGIVVSFGHLIPARIIQCFPLGMINVHASLLPRWRGAAPIIYALMHGDSCTGVSIMKIMPKRFDVGEILAQKAIDIHPDEIQPKLYSKLAQMGANLLVDTIEQMPDVLNSGRPQSESNVTYAPKITKKISIVNWPKLTANQVYNLQRALTDLFPLTTSLRGKKMKLFGVKLSPTKPEINDGSTIIPGLVLYSKHNNLLVVQCQDGNWVSVEEISMEGRRKMSAKDFYNGFMANKEKVIFEIHENLLNELSENAG